MDIEKVLYKYMEHSASHRFIIGFKYNGFICFSYVNNLMDYVRIDRTSEKNGGSPSIRFYITKKQILKLKTIHSLCDIATFERIRAEYNINKGETFEKLILELFNQEWHYNNVPFYKRGDICIDGIDYQIKFQRATITTVKTLQGL